MTREEIKVGDTAGYVVLIRDRFDRTVWNETPSGIFNTIAQAVSMVDRYEDDQKHSDRKDAFAVARLVPVMISRPDDA